MGSALKESLLARLLAFLYAVKNQYVASFGGALVTAAIGIVGLLRNEPLTWLVTLIALIACFAYAVFRAFDQERAARLATNRRPILVVPFGHSVRPWPLHRWMDALVLAAILCVALTILFFGAPMYRRTVSEGELKVSITHEAVGFGRSASGPVIVTAIVLENKSAEDLQFVAYGRIGLAASTHAVNHEALLAQTLMAQVRREGPNRLSGRGVIPANRAGYYAPSLPVSNHQIADFKAGRQTLYFGGIVDVRNRYGAEKTLEFCRLVERARGPIQTCPLIPGDRE